MKTQVIFDCDPGVDDALALLLALRSEELKLKDLFKTIFPEKTAEIDQYFKNMETQYGLEGVREITSSQESDRKFALGGSPLITTREQTRVEMTD